MEIKRALDFCENADLSPSPQQEVDFLLGRIAAICDREKIPFIASAALEPDMRGVQLVRVLNKSAPESLKNLFDAFARDLAATVHAHGCTS